MKSRKGELHLDENQEWLSLAQASLKLGHDRSYISLWLRRHPDSVPKEYLINTGTVNLISTKGVEWIEKNTKKEGVLVNSNSVNEDQHLKRTILDETLSCIIFYKISGGTSNFMLN
jgi:hypothetical protein